MQENTDSYWLNKQIQDERCVFTWVVSTCWQKRCMQSPPSLSQKSFHKKMTHTWIFPMDLSDMNNPQSAETDSW